jgi:hypothetical protein
MSKGVLILVKKRLLRLVADAECFWAFSDEA